jgi:hypothetical protein
MPNIFGKALTRRTTKQAFRKASPKQQKISVIVKTPPCNYESIRAGLRAEHNTSPQMTAALREFFDEWVDTGLHANGEEHPFERNPNKMPNGIRVCHDFLKKNPWTTILGSGGHRISFPSASAETMRSIMGSFLISGGEPAAVEKWREYAVQAFIEFLGTPRCFHFVKCRGCAQYFDLKKKPKKVYSGGWHCAPCQKELAANRATLATMKARTVRQLERNELAAYAWAKWKEDSVEPDSAWILTQATGDNPHKVNRLGLTANYITLHRDEIRKMALSFRESDGHARG